LFRKSWGGMVDDVHMFSSTFVGDLRLGLTRYDAYYNQGSAGYDPTKLGFPLVHYLQFDASHDARVQPYRLLREFQRNQHHQPSERLSGIQQLHQDGGGRTPSSSVEKSGCRTSAISVGRTP